MLAWCSTLHYGALCAIPREHSAIRLTFIKLPYVLKTLVLSNAEWPLKTGFTVHVLNVFYQTIRKDPIA